MELTIIERFDCYLAELSALYNSVTTQQKPLKQGGIKVENVLVQIAKLRTTIEGCRYILNKK